MTPPDRAIASGSDGKAGGRPELPLYYRVYKTLEQRIQERRVLPGERLPSEDELCREFGVTRDYLRVMVCRAKQSFKSYYLRASPKTPARTRLARLASHFAGDGTQHNEPFPLIHGLKTAGRRT